MQWVSIICWSLQAEQAQSKKVGSWEDQMEKKGIGLLQKY
jgi:hypothetical protein